MINKLLIAFEALDGAGKETQTKLLRNKLAMMGYGWHVQSFPRYNEVSSDAIVKYKAGGFPEIEPKQACQLYAHDRFVAYHSADSEFKKAYNDGYICIMDRYVTSNMLYQIASSKTIEEKEDILNFIYDLEYTINKLPVPDIVIYLKVPAERSFDLIQKRNAETNFTGIDLLERKENLKAVETNYQYLVEKYGWTVIECMNGDVMKTPHEIHEEILDVIFLKNMINPKCE
jgi:dTMP kinase